MVTQAPRRGKKSSAQHEKVYEVLRSDILEGRFVGGEKLVELDLAARFKVSRTPIREAFYKLERDGLVKRTVNVGVIVAKASPQSIGNHLEMLTLLETFAVARWAESEHLLEDLDDLTALQDGMKQALQDKDVETFETLNRQFHARFLERNANDYLRTLVDMTRERLFNLSLESFPSALHIEQYLIDHDQILQSARTGTPQDVADAMRRHLGHVGVNIARAR